MKMSQYRTKILQLWLFYKWIKYYIQIHEINKIYSE